MSMEVSCDMGRLTRKIRSSADEQVFQFRYRQHSRSRRFCLTARLAAHLSGRVLQRNPLASIQLLLNLALLSCLVALVLAFS